MPETVSLRLEEVSEEALKERIHLRKVTAAVDMYDQLLQAGENTYLYVCLFFLTRVAVILLNFIFFHPGSAISIETTHDLLDLICLYGDRNPVQEGEPQTEETVSDALSKHDGCSVT